MTDTTKYIWNVDVDFNNPRRSFVTSRPVKVGDVVRLIDTDPTAGYCLGKVTKVTKKSPVQRHCEAKDIEGTYVGWEPWERTGMGWTVDDPANNYLWRVGRKLGRTIYAQVGDEPSDDDELLGLMETTEIAEHVVRDHNVACRGVGL